MYCFIQLDQTINDKIKIVSDVFYKEVGKEHKRRRFYKIQCLKCGKFFDAMELSLKKGKYKYCSCYKKIGKRIKGNPKNKNTYDLSGEYGIGYTENVNQIFFFDLEDYKYIKNYHWYLNGQGYIETHSHKQKILMHRFVLQQHNKLHKEDVIDHKNKLRYCNIKSNLNIVTKLENNQNTRLYKNNTSGYKGVSYDSNLQKWRSYINHQHKRIYGGNFNDINDAIESRKQLEIQYFEYYTNVQESLKHNKVTLWTK